MRRTLFLFLLIPALLFSQTFRKKYQGSIGPYPITITLVSKNGNLTGTYYYESFDDPISVRGFVTGKSIRFNGFDLKGNKIDEFIGQYNKHDIHGIWIGEGMQKRFNFKLIEVSTPMTQLEDAFSFKGVFLGLLGALVLFSAGVYLYVRKTKHVPHWLSKLELLYKRLFIPQRIGYEFERYMTDRLDPHKYRLVEWRNRNKKFSITGSPGLVFERRFAGEGLRRFGIACRFFDKEPIDVIPIDKPQYFQNDKPVFVALGFGGRPSAPDSVYLVPIEKVQGNIISLRDITNFKILGATVEFDPHSNTIH